MAVYNSGVRQYLVFVKFCGLFCQRKLLCLFMSMGIFGQDILLAFRQYFPKWYVPVIQILKLLPPLTPQSMFFGIQNSQNTNLTIQNSVGLGEFIFS